jgi:hypothetical protein
MKKASPEQVDALQRMYGNTHVAAPRRAVAAHKAEMKRKLFGTWGGWYLIAVAAISVVMLGLNALHQI